MAVEGSLELISKYMRVFPELARRLEQAAADERASQNYVINCALARYLAMEDVLGRKLELLRTAQVRGPRLTASLRHECPHCGRTVRGPGFFVHLDACGKKKEASKQ